MTAAPFALPVFSSKNLRAWPKHPEGGAAGYQLAAAALCGKYSSDAHAAAYSAPSVPRRLDKGAPGQPVDGAPLVVLVAFLFVDVDGADHKADPAWRQSEASKITRALAELPGGFCYQTRGGYRLVWRLAQPFPITGPDDAARWRRHYWRALLSLSRRFAIEGDPACSDWTRLYRLPYATRPRADGSPGEAPEELPTEGDPELAPALAFEPDPAYLALDLAEARRLAALYPATKDDAGKTTIAGPWGAAVKALAREAGEGEPEGDAASLPLQDAPPAAGPGAAPPPRSSSPRPAPSSAPASPRSRRPDIEERERLWCEKALGRHTDELARTTRGGRNNLARNAALVLGHYAPHLLSPADIERALMQACGRNGLVRDDGRDAALVTIKNAIVDGMRTPKRPTLSDDGPAWRAQQHRPGRPTDHSTTDEGASMPDPTADEHHQADEAAPFLPLATSRSLPAFPLAALPSPVATFVDQLAEYLECPVDLPACLALGALASVCMKRYEASPRVDWREPLNLYLAVALEPGESKSPAFRQVFGPLYAMQKQMGEDWKAECKRIDERNTGKSKGEPDEEKPPRPRIFIDDATPEKIGVVLSEQGERITLASDEGGAFQQMCGLYSKNGQANVDVYLKAHDGGHYAVDRMVRASIFLENPLMTVALAVQPTVIRALAKRPELRERGLWGRFVYAFPASRVGTHTYNTPPVDPQARDDWRDLVARLAAPPLPREPEVLRFSPDAWERFNAATVEISRAQLPGGALSSVRDWASKLRGFLARVAGLLHVAEEIAPGQARISLATVERALEIGRYFTRHALYTFDVEMTLDPAEQAARGLWEVITRKGWTRVTPREVTRAVKPLRKTPDAIAALEVLCRQGCLERAPAHHGKAYLVRGPSGGEPGGSVVDHRRPVVDPLSTDETEDDVLETQHKDPLSTGTVDPHTHAHEPPRSHATPVDEVDNGDNGESPDLYGGSPGANGVDNAGRQWPAAPSPPEPTTTPPPVSGVATAPGAPANDLPAVDLAAGDDEGWEPLE